MSILFDQKVAELTARWGEPHQLVESDDNSPIWRVDVQGKYGSLEIIDAPKCTEFLARGFAWKFSVHHFLGSISDAKAIDVEVSSPRGQTTRFTVSTPMDVFHVPAESVVKITTKTPIALLYVQDRPYVAKSNVTKINFAHINRDASEVKPGQVLLWSAQRPMVRGEVSQELILKNMFGDDLTNKPKERSDDPRLKEFWDRVDNPSTVEVRFFTKPTPNTSNGQSKNSFDFPATTPVDAQSLEISTPTI